MANQATTIFTRPESLNEVVTHYCPGCTHGIIHRLVAESLDELQLRDKTVGVAPVGCSVLIYNYFNCDFLEAPHGRAPALATGFKRLRPDMIVFTYQGDGDLASIGMGEIVHAANRGEKITVIFVNNAIYGMTGGQMAPTTLPGQITTTSPAGRDTASAGHPIRMSELLATLRTPSYIERVSVHSPQHIIQAKRAIKKAFTYQSQDRCFSLVEVVSTCPTNWGMSPTDSTKWLEDNLLAYYKLGLYSEPDDEEDS
ncbi:MAG: 2-oxoglutarate oxidoreductase [candidate division Zixibacteria bacterium]|nr:2-oxoglutarate oxidoreductase [candidate division Zixibacteria bacterium]